MRKAERPEVGEMGEAEGQFRMRLMIASNDSFRSVCESIESSGLINIVMQNIW